VTTSSIKPRPVVWSVAGSDSGAGAGLQADLKAFEAFGGVHGCTVIASVTAQNSQAVSRIEPVSAALFEAQLDALQADLPPRVIKTGLIADADLVRRLAQRVRQLRAADQAAGREPVALVVDPLRRASTGAEFGGEALRRAMLDELLPLADVITPNRAEAAWLLGEPTPVAQEINALSALADQARRLQALGPSTVVITGGDTPQQLGSSSATLQCLDWLLCPQAEGALLSPRLDVPHNHGTGCVFASTLAAALAARGFCEADAVVLAKMATTEALRCGYAAGRGAGPVCPRAGFASDGRNLPRFVPAQSLRIDPGALQVAAPFAQESGLDLYVIADSAEWVERVAREGVRTIQLRLKPEVAASRGVDLADEITRCVVLQRQYGLKFYVNDHWQLALSAGAWGVHVGQEDLESVDVEALRRAGVRLGVSSHSLWELARAAHLRPSYVACGPVHATTTKDMPWQPQGLTNLSWWTRALAPVPVVGIGGFTPARLQEAATTRADGLAVLSGITAAADPQEAIATYLAALRMGRQAEAFVAARPQPSLYGRWGS
jgi:hydroxymethylpyrimidine kinase / phosphomethylpyrimidine kinase / thiamine-phosphate diphosphorylase